MVAIVRKSLSRLLASCYVDQTRQAGTEQPNGSGNGDESWWETRGFCRREQPVNQHPYFSFLATSKIQLKITAISVPSEYSTYESVN